MKPHMMRITDAKEIASIERNGLADIIGGKDASGYWAYTWSIRRWRALQTSQRSNDAIT
jgi:hypothetical protein